MFIELHLLQNFAPSNLNRDDTGAPKECTFGGYRRARISSQCLKRAIRSHFQSAKLFPEELLAVRTKRVVDAIADRLVAERKDREAAVVAATNLLAAAGLKVVNDEGEPKTQYLLYLASKEIARLAEIAGGHWDVLAKAKPDGGGEGSKSAKKAKQDAKAALPKQVQEAVVEALGSALSVDLALFGRMLADRQDKSVEAACQVAHAISVNEVAMEMDFYTAVDDLRPEDNQGADMMGVVEFNSSCFYRYAKLDLDLLRKNLGDDHDLARRAAVAFVRSSIAAIPTGKQNSMAAHNPPSYVRAVVRREGEAWNLVNAFTRPARVKRNGEDDLTALAVGALETHLAALRRMYGDGPTPGSPDSALVADFSSSLFDPKSLSVPDLLAGLETALT